MTSCKTNKDASQDDMEEMTQQEMRDKATATKLIVNLKPEYLPKDLEAAFSHYELKSQSRTNKTLNAWLFTFNPETVKRKRLINLLNKHDYVVRAKGLGGQKGGVELSKSSSKKRTKIATQ